MVFSIILQNNLAVFIKATHKPILRSKNFILTYIEAETSKIMYENVPTDTSHNNQNLEAIKSPLNSKKAKLLWFSHMLG